MLTPCNVSVCRPVVTLLSSLVDPAVIRIDSSSPLSRICSLPTKLQAFPTPSTTRSSNRQHLWIIDRYSQTPKLQRAGPPIYSERFTAVADRARKSGAIIGTGCLFLNRARPHDGGDCAESGTLSRWIYRDDDPNRVTIVAGGRLKSFTEVAARARANARLTLDIVYDINIYRVLNTAGRADSARYKSSHSHRPTVRGEAVNVNLPGLAGLQRWFPATGLSIDRRPPPLARPACQGHLHRPGPRRLSPRH